MKVRIQENLLFISATLTFRNQTLTLDRVVLDTGSAGTLFQIDRVAEIGLVVGDDDQVDSIFGVGGTEVIAYKRIDRLNVGEFRVDNFEVQVGAMEYAPDLDGILGLDFLLRVGAVIDLANLELRSD
ncbi:MAG: hypothetical protein HC853_15410 [Anaerolineae bacterium]|nr:hypothetical protein [Anaerolineae bacterium]